MLNLKEHQIQILFPKIGPQSKFLRLLEAEKGVLTSPLAKVASTQLVIREIV